MTASAMAATSGTLGTSSTARSDISMHKQDVVIGTDIADLNLGSMGSLTSTTSASDSVCIYTSTGAYTITFSSSNGSFSLSDSNTTTDIPYSVDWTTAESAANAAYNTEISGLVGNSNSMDCNGSSNATLSVSIAALDFNAAEPGNYSDILTMNLRAE